MRRKKGAPVHGWAVLDKPAGMTSTRAVALVRRALNAQKAGHAGTLDPLATGALAVALGEATKTIPFIMDSDKTYRFTALWGQARATDDAEGAVTGESPVRPSAAAIVEALPRFVGEVTQVPPAYSAIKVDGERAYDLAREGEVVDLKPRTVTIRRVELVGAEADRADFEMVCGKGTYVRAFVRDLAKALGTLGYVGALRRTRLGPFGPADLIPLATLPEMGYEPALRNGLRPVATALDGIPALAVTAADAARLKRGQTVMFRKELWSAWQEAGAEGRAAGLAALVGPGGALIALAEPVQGALQPVRVFHLDAAETTT